MQTGNEKLLGWTTEVFRCGIYAKEATVSVQ